MRSRERRNSLLLRGLASSRLRNVLLIHHSCRPANARATSPSCTYPHWAGVISKAQAWLFSSRIMKPTPRTVWINLG